MNTFMTRDESEARDQERAFRAQVGQVVGRYGRITETLVDVDVREIQFRGRPLFQVIPIVSVVDPLFDGNQPTERPLIPIPPYHTR